MRTLGKIQIKQFVWLNCDLEKWSDEINLRTSEETLGSIFVKTLYYQISHTDDTSLKGHCVYGSLVFKTEQLNLVEFLSDSSSERTYFSSLSLNVENDTNCREVVH